jgi:cytoskeletal protein RodZ
MHPLGPLPPRAYWLRRTLLLVVLVLVVALVWWLLAGRGSGSGGAAPPTTSPTASLSNTPTTTPTSTTTSPTSHPTTTPTPTHTPSPAPTGPCPDSVIRVVALTNASTYPAGVDPKLTVSVTNTGSVPCKRDVGQAALTLTVSSGSSRTWSSDDCNPGGGSAINTLKPGQTFSSTVDWTRTKSKPGCPSGQPAAPPGAYQLVARDLSTLSAPAPFTLQ